MRDIDQKVTGIRSYLIKYRIWAPKNKCKNFFPTIGSQFYIYFWKLSLSATGTILAPDFTLDNYRLVVLYSRQLQTCSSHLDRRVRQSYFRIVRVRQSRFTHSDNKV